MNLKVDNLALSRWNVVENHKLTYEPSRKNFLNCLEIAIFEISIESL